jgi:hypothetical protein
MAANKVYDSNTAATFTGTTVLSGLVAGDDVTLGGMPACSFADEHVAIDVIVTVTGSTISGIDATNYTFTQQMGLTANITPKALTVIGLTAANKVYDGSTAAIINTAGAALLGVVSGDTVTLNTVSATGVFSDSNIGTGKTVTISGLTIGGADAAKYSLTQPTTTASIIAGGGGGGGLPGPVLTTTPTTTPTTTTTSTTTTTPTTTPIPPTTPALTTTPTTTPSTTVTPTPHQLKVDVEGQTGLVTINEDGTSQEAALVTSKDKRIGIIIPNGTTVLTKDNSPPGQLTILPDEDPPAPPPAFNLIGVPYECLPSGVTFSPPITLVWNYDPASLPAGTDETKLQVCLYNNATGQWDVINGVVDTVNNTISATISHFSIYSVIALVVAPVTPSPDTTTPDYNLWLLIVIVIVIAAVVTITMLVIRKKRNAHKA